MKSCNLTITTSVDGRETDFSCVGELGLTARSATLRYTQENASVSLVLEGETAKIDRTGDYSLQLFLKRGEESDGTLGLGGNDGGIKVFTHRVAYSLRQDSLLASLHYDLVFGDERQEMKLRILARYKK